MLIVSGNPQDIKLFIISSTRFYCGIEVAQGKVIKTTPVVNYMFGWKIENVEAYCEKKRWIFYYYS